MRIFTKSSRHNVDVKCVSIALTMEISPKSTCPYTNLKKLYDTSTAKFPSAPLFQDSKGNPLLYRETSCVLPRHRFPLLLHCHFSTLVFPLISTLFISTLTFSSVSKLVFSLIFKLLSMLVCTLLFDESCNFLSHCYSHCCPH